MLENIKPKLTQKFYKSKIEILDLKTTIENKINSRLRTNSKKQSKMKHGKPKDKAQKRRETEDSNKA